LAATAPVATANSRISPVEIGRSGALVASPAPAGGLSSCGMMGSSDGGGRSGDDQAGKEGMTVAN
jgi:hypothetical protein